MPRSNRKGEAEYIETIYKYTCSECGEEIEHDEDCHDGEIIKCPGCQCELTVTGKP